jgi:glycosyltransferase involved in cell wall biosynthesis
LTQQDVSVRVLIIDDASTDGTPSAGKALVGRDSRVEYRRHDVNKGHIATYNEGLLGWASAPYSVLLSADDALTPGALGRAVRFLNAHPEAGMTCGRALIVNDATSRDAIPLEMSDESYVMPGATFLHRCCAFANPVSTPTVVVRTEIQHRVGGYLATLPHSGDMEMWMRFATSSSIGFLRAVQAYYRWHGANMGITYYDSALGDLQEQRAACDEALKTWDASVPEKRTLRDAVNRRVAQSAFWMASSAFDAGELTRSRACLRFAKELCPELEQTGQWRRLRAKQLLGPALWQRLRPAIGRLRGLPDSPPILGPIPFRVGEPTGWWPGDVE